MKNGGGRTSRIRRRKLFRSSESRGVNESYKPEFIELKKWLKDRRFEDATLIPARFPGTGRGLMSKTSLQPLFSEAIETIFSYRALQWAWCTVNTRAVYMKRPPQLCLSPEPDTCALAPYLDLLNHSPDVQVKAAFNEETRCYEIRTATRCGKHKEVFICYGPHDNHRLLLEYGFVSVSNPHACVYVSKDILVKYLPSTAKQMNKKISILEDHDFIENLTFGWDGPSWRLLTALKLLCLEAEEFMCWKKVLLGEIISDTNEKTSLDVAQKICCYFIEETHAVLRKESVRDVLASPQESWPGVTSSWEVSASERPSFWFLASGSHSQHQFVHIRGFLLSKGNPYGISIFKLRKAMALGKIA